MNTPSHPALDLFAEVERLTHAAVLRGARSGLRELLASFDALEVAPLAATTAPPPAAPPAPDTKTRPSAKKKPAPTSPATTAKPRIRKAKPTGKDPARALSATCRAFLDAVQLEPGKTLRELRPILAELGAPAATNPGAIAKAAASVEHLLVVRGEREHKRFYPRPEAAPAPAAE